MKKSEVSFVFKRVNSSREPSFKSRESIPTLEFFFASRLSFFQPKNLGDLKKTDICKNQSNLSWGGPLTKLFHGPP